MGPWDVVHEFFQNECRGDGAAVGAADVFHVGHVAFQMLAIFLDQWELPKPLSGLPRTAHELVSKRLIIAKKTSNRWTESHHAGARQCRQVEHVIRLFLRAARQDASQDPSTLGVSD